MTFFLLLFWNGKTYLLLQVWNNLVIIIFNAFWNCGKQHIYDLLSRFLNRRAIIKGWKADILQRNGEGYIEAIYIHIMTLLVSSSSRNIICDEIIHPPRFINIYCTNHIFLEDYLPLSKIHFKYLIYRLMGNIYNKIDYYMLRLSCHCRFKIWCFRRYTNALLRTLIVEVAFNVWSWFLVNK